MEESNLLEIKKLYVKKKDKVILRNLNVDKINAKRIGIVGSNGAGKTILIKCILGLEVFQGEIQLYVDKSKVQVIMQRNSYPMYAKSKNILKLILNVDNLNGIQYLIDRFKFSKCLDTDIKNLSGGELQKLNLILVLDLKPRLLIVDEITTGLDFETRSMLISYLDSYLEENDCKIILVSHYPEEINRLTEKVISMKNGEITKICNTCDFKWGDM